MIVLPPGRLKERSMSTATEYRRFLDECLHWTDNARSREERKTFLQMAKTWHEAALRLEQSLGA
jgi:hypothetical protein